MFLFQYTESFCVWPPQHPFASEQQQINCGQRQASDLSTPEQPQLFFWWGFPEDHRFFLTISSPSSPFTNNTFLDKINFSVFDLIYILALLSNSSSRHGPIAPHFLPFRNRPEGRVILPQRMALSFY